MMIEWQPIETAPKDGRDILLGHFCSGGGKVFFHCMSDFWDVDGYWNNYVTYKAEPTHWAYFNPPSPPDIKLVSEYPSVFITDPNGVKHPCVPKIVEEGEIDINVSVA